MADCVSANKFLTSSFVIVCLELSSCKEVLKNLASLK